MKQLSSLSCLFNQVKGDDFSVYAFYSATKEITVVRNGTDAAEHIIKLVDVPYNILLSPKGNFLTVVYLKSY